MKTNNLFYVKEPRCRLPPRALLITINQCNTELGTCVLPNGLVSVDFDKTREGKINQNKIKDNQIALNLPVKHF